MAGRDAPQGQGWVHYDRTINLGHIMTACAMVLSALGAVIYLQSDLRRLEIDQERLRAEMVSDIAAIRSDASSREGRLRATELTIAGQASDLRAMSASLLRIERLLERPARP